MSSSSENLSRIMRGVAEVISADELCRKLEKKPSLRIKMGVDPTAPDLHLGHLVCLRKLRQFQEAGHQVVFIIGDYTALIGDPTGQSATRPTLTPEQVLENSKTYQEQVFRILNPAKTELVHNSSWFKPMGADGKLLELMKQATAAQMLQRADFAKRYADATPITLLELFYPVLQGYDSVAVKADLELGGTDQKFNLLMGREFQQNNRQEPQVIMMMPLLEGLDGVRKMSKSYGNYVAFNDPPKEMFGKLMSIPDSLMLKYFELLTDHDLQPIPAMHPREAKALLARTLTAQFHGEAAAEAASSEFDRVFSRKEVPEDIPEVKVPSGYRKVVDLVFDVRYPEISKKEAHRLVEQGAVEIGDKRMNVNDYIEIVSGQIYTVRIGKRGFYKAKGNA